MAPITNLISQYPILSTLACYLSTLDLYHLGQTCRANHSQILSSRRLFDVLRRDCLCDGHGLAERQDFRGSYSLERRHYNWGGERHIWRDEPIEVRLYGTKCDEAGALPCRKCGVNVCEECRSYPREPPEEEYPMRRPHLNAPYQSENVMCLCPDCDAKVEDQVRGCFLNELCDCDIFMRWICSKCVKEELDFTWDYYKEHTELEGYGKTKSMQDHQHSRDFYCLCGANVPGNTRPRCTWCKRRHLPEEDWYEELEEIGCKMPMFENDPCYPPFIGDIYAASCNKPYPRLAYDGPIWKAPTGAAEL